MMNTMSTKKKTQKVKPEMTDAERIREDERLREAYEDTLGEILENDDEDARDNLAEYMDELKEESENVGRPPQTD